MLSCFVNLKNNSGQRIHGKFFVNSSLDEIDMFFQKYLHFIFFFKWKNTNKNIRITEVLGNTGANNCHQNIKREIYLREKCFPDFLLDQFINFFNSLTHSFYS